MNREEKKVLGVIMESREEALKGNVRSRFNKLLEERLNKTKSIFINKNKEYGDDDDVFHNFNLAGKINSETPEKSLWGMATKHLTSIIDIVRDPSVVTEHMIDEKIGDLILYLILLEGLLKEKYIYFKGE